MNKHFVCQLTDAARITNNKDTKQYMNQLKGINTRHNFIALRALYGEDCETEMHRAMLLENLQHIHENLCCNSRIKPPNPYKEMRPINFTNKNIQSCQVCGGKFSSEEGSAELVCVNCGRIEILDGTAFLIRKTYNIGTKTKTRQYTFKYRLQKLLDNCRYPVKLSTSQIEEACYIFKHRLPKQICYPFLIFKILEQMITEEPQLRILRYIQTKVPASTYLKHERRWNKLMYANYGML